MNLADLYTGRWGRLKLDADTRKQNYLELADGRWLAESMCRRLQKVFPKDTNYFLEEFFVRATHARGQYKILTHGLDYIVFEIYEGKKQGSKIMKLKKSRKAEVCDAMRCAVPHKTINSDGTKFCMKHAGQYMNGAPMEQATEADEKNAITTPAESEIKEAAAPDFEYADAVIMKLGKIEIKNQGMLDKIGELLTDVKSRYKILEKQRTDATAPLNKAKTTIDGWFAPAKSRLKECESLLKAKINTYTRKLFDEKQKALEVGDHETAITTAPAELPTNMSQRTVLDYHIVDLDAVPRKYLCLDHSAVKLALAEHGRDLSIPGIKVYEKPVLSVRS